MKYRIHQKSYIGNVVVDPDGPDGSNEIEVAPHVFFGGRVEHQLPGPHWEPVDAEAKAHCAKLKHVFTGMIPDPVNSLSPTMDAPQLPPGVISDTALAAIGTAVGKSVIEALIAAGVIKAPEAGAAEEGAPGAPRTGTKRGRVAADDAETAGA